MSKEIDWVVTFQIRLAIVVIGMIVIVLGGVVASGVLISSAMTTATVDITVTEKVGAHGENGDYMIFTGKEVFVVEDNWFKWKFDASDRWRVLKEGASYHCIVTGMRYQPLSFYRNLIECEEI